MQCRLTAVETENFLTLGAHPYMQTGSHFMNAVTGVPPVVWLARRGLLFDLLLVSCSVPTYFVSVL